MEPGAEHEPVHRSFGPENAKRPAVCGEDGSTAPRAGEQVHPGGERPRELSQPAV